MSINEQFCIYERKSDRINSGLFMQEQICSLNMPTHYRWWNGIPVFLVLTSLSTPMTMLVAATKVFSRVTKHKR